MADGIQRPVRTRFAPSPTGSLHIGGLRTALYNWLFARHHGGTFILRIEDTDQKRFDPNALRILMESLRWAGLDWDEGPEVGGAYGPYIQSERLALYQEWARWLVENDKAYPSYETAEELDRMRKDMEARKLPPGYNRAHRTLTLEQRAAYEAQGRQPVIRLKMPLEGETVIHDAIQGDIRFENSQLQDTVLLKSDGFPTYHLAHVVDDHFMQISHVMRAVEWMPSLPIHWQLWQAFGWDAPVYAHVPVMLNPNGKGKISKRNPPKDETGKVIPVLVHDYIEGGYLPEAVLNFLANMSWKFDETQEIFSVAEAIERFDLTGMNPVNSAFPNKKLEWMNGEYLRAIPPEQLAPLLRAPLERAGLTVDEARLHAVAPLVQTRIRTLNDVVEIGGFIFRELFTPPEAGQLIPKGMDASAARDALAAARDLLATLPNAEHAATHDAMKALAEQLGIKHNALFSILRVAVTAQTVSTPLFETMEIFGKDETLRRLDLALDTLRQAA